MSSNLQIRKTCLFCGCGFISKTTVTQYCSHHCAQRAYKQRKRELKIEKVIPTATVVSGRPTILSHRDYLSCEEVADLMGISRTTVYRYCVTGKMKCIRMNRKIFIKRSDVNQLFDNAGPYEVIPVDQKPITEFYSMKEITEKYGVSESTVYNTVNAKRIPKVLSRGKTIYSRKHIDKHFLLKAPDPQIFVWYSAKEIRQKYDMSTSAVHSFTSEYAIPRKKGGGRTYYSAKHVDALLEQRKPDPSIREWYSMNDIVTLYNFEPGYVSNLIYKNPIPKIRRGNKGYYSKEHFDRLVREKQLVPEYYTVEEAMAKYNLTRDTLYHHIRDNNPPKIKDGRYIKISKPELDAIFEQPITI